MLEAYVLRPQATIYFESSLGYEQSAWTATAQFIVPYSELQIPQAPISTCTSELMHSMGELESIELLNDWKKRHFFVVMEYSTLPVIARLQIKPLID